MTTLEKNALRRLPLSKADLERLYEDEGPVLWKVMKPIIESHERLRMELEGSAELHNDSAKDLRQAADDAQRIRDGLLRIFARAPDWSGECTQANLADLLGMTVREVQDEINDLPEGGDS